MTNYDKLQNAISEADALLGKTVKWRSPEVQAWHNKAVRMMIHCFGEESYECRSFRRISYESMILDEQQAYAACKRGIEQAKAVLLTYVEEFEHEREKSASKRKIEYNRVFIVHGHDGELKQAVARLIESQGIEAIILTEQANQGKTIIEKFENYSDVGGAICLFTADDIGRANAESSDHSRARQNVVFETGYFIGKLGRDHIVILADKGIEMPSDLSGVVRTNTGNWQFDLLKEMKAIGYVIDLNLLF